MVQKTNLTVSISQDVKVSELVLLEVAEDNKKPSDIFKEEIKKKQGADCINENNIDKSVDKKVEECLLDLKWWRTRRLRLFPPVLPKFRTVNCSSKNGSTGVQSEIVLLQFNGSTSAQLPVPADSVKFAATDDSDPPLFFSLFDSNGDSVFISGSRKSASVTFDGHRTINVSKEVYGVIALQYFAPYRTVLVTVRPTGEDIKAWVSAIKDNQVASLSLDFKVETCPETGLVLGCEESKALDELEKSGAETINFTTVDSLTGQFEKLKALVNSVIIQSKLDATESGEDIEDEVTGEDILGAVWIEDVTKRRTSTRIEGSIQIKVIDQITMKPKLPGSKPITLIFKNPQ